MKVNEINEINEINYVNEESDEGIRQLNTGYNQTGNVMMGAFWLERMK